MLGSLIAFQVAMVAWRARSPRSFDIVTLIGLWIVPPVLFLSGEHALEYMRFYVIWVLFTLGNLYFFRYVCGAAHDATLSFHTHVS